MSNVEEKIKAIIVDKLKVDAADVSPEKEIVRDLGAANDEDDVAPLLR